MVEPQFSKWISLSTQWAYVDFTQQ